MKGLAEPAPWQGRQRLLFLGPEHMEDPPVMPGDILILVQSRGMLFDDVGGHDLHHHGIADRLGLAAKVL